jgi:hypothetical protein
MTTQDILRNMEKYRSIPMERVILLLKISKHYAQNHHR